MWYCQQFMLLKKIVVVDRILLTKQRDLLIEIDNGEAGVMETHNFYKVESPFDSEPPYQFYARSSCRRLCFMSRVYLAPIYGNVV